MALNPHRGMGTEDIGDLTAPLYFSDAMSKAIFAENTLLPRIKKGEEVDQPVMHWVEDSINPFQVSVVDMDSVDTSVTLAAGQGRLVRVGTILKTTTQSSLVEELIRVTGKTGDTLTIERGYGNTTAVSTHTTNAELLTIIGNPLEENSGLQADMSKARVSKQTYFQVFEKSVELSRRQMKRKMIAVENEFIKQIGMRTVEAKRELENAVIYQRAKATDPAGDYSTMRGILDQLTDSYVPDAWIKDASGASLTDSLLNAYIAQVYQNGGSVDILFASQFQSRQFASPAFFGGGSATGIRWTSSERVRGTYVRQFLSDIGAVVDIVSSPFFRKDALALLNSEMLSLHAYAESDWFMIQAPTLFDGKATRLVGDYGLKLQHAGETHLLVRNLATS